MKTDPQAGNYHNCTDPTTLISSMKTLSTKETAPSNHPIHEDLHSVNLSHQGKTTQTPALAIDFLAKLTKLINNAKRPIFPPTARSLPPTKPKSKNSTKSTSKGLTETRNAKGIKAKD